MRIYKTITASVFALLIAGAFTATQAQDASLLVGAGKCKMCHKKPEAGEQYGKWEAGPHAKAFATLGSDEAKAKAAELGLGDPQTEGKCLKCHSTAYNFTEEKATESIAVEEGVSCESCHGPGQNYKKKSVMKDRAQALAGGMVDKPKDQCIKCHNEENPFHKEFNVEERYEEIKHEIPE